MHFLVLRCISLLNGQGFWWCATTAEPHTEFVRGTWHHSILHVVVAFSGGGGGMTTGLEIPRMILTSCQTQSVQHCLTVPQSQSVLSCCSRSANQISTKCCLEITACTRWPLVSNGQVAMSALGSGRACPTAVVNFCPSCRRTALPQYELRPNVALGAMSSGF